MKRFGVLALAVVAVMVFTGVAFASKTNTGCGLGQLIFKGHEGLVSQTCAATFNGTFGNQTFGITSGTSECDQFKTVWASERLNIFVADNMDGLAKDIAQGSGEYLNTLAVLLEVPEGQRVDFYSRLQSNFSQIYTSDQVTSIDVLKNIETVISPT
ncbi:MAG TPA: DUF3015 domain-containing protein [Syntrophobacteria bacterium]|nr:DUF3015 domain-containing protein [Syntrophobacteria bacterium]